MNTKVTVIILDYLKAARLVENVKLIMAQEVNFGFKVIVIDNSCNEENANILREGLKDYPQVELVVNTQNLGYIRAHNVVKDKIEGELVTIVNPDVLLKEKDSFQKMVDYMDRHKEVGILGPKQINDNGEVAMTVRAFPKLYIQVARRTFLRSWPIFRKKVAYDEMRHLDYSKIQDVDWLQSSCVLIRRKLWDKIGGLSEKYFLFMSDVELSAGAWNNGYRVVYYPDTKVYADGKRISAGGVMQFFKSWVLRQHVKDSIKYRLRYFLKNSPRKAYYRKNGLPVV